MSIVKYTNKKTGYVAVYESTSYYDPGTKQSRPKRKYLGHEDPITGEFIPSNGQRGRRKSIDQADRTLEDSTRTSQAFIDQLESKDQQIKELKELNAQLSSQVRDLKAALLKISNCIPPDLLM